MQLPGGSIYLVTVGPSLIGGNSNLDPINYIDFGNALISIWKQYCEKVNDEHNSQNKIIFNLTGGYKAVGMVLAALVAANTAIPISIIYLHETAPSESLFIMNFQGGIILDRLLTGYCDSGNPPVGQVMATI
jgi:hypothetical protein